MIKRDRLYTQENVDVTRFFDEEKTKFFEDKDKANDYAKKRNSYTYRVFAEKRKDHYHYKDHIGFGVPN